MADPNSNIYHHAYFAEDFDIYPDSYFYPHAYFAEDFDIHPDSYFYPNSHSDFDVHSDSDVGQTLAAEELDAFLNQQDVVIGRRGGSMVVDEYSKH
jgi:hypothetical protein